MYMYCNTKYISIILCQNIKATTGFRNPIINHRNKKKRLEHSLDPHSRSNVRYTHLLHFFPSWKHNTPTSAI